MTFLPRLIAVVLAGYGTAVLAGSAMLPIAWRLFKKADTQDADSVFLHRLVPAAVGALAAILGAVSFLRFEPRAGVEPTGLVLPLFGLVTLVLLAASTVRLWITYAASRVPLRDWLQSAEPITLPQVPIPAFVIASAFPIVAIIGVLRPKMVVARSVLEGCTAPELRAIIAHELWHLRRRDNARRALLSAVPDVLNSLRFSERVRQQWHLAAEQAADGAAIRSSATGRVDLASALLRVARLAPAGGPLTSMPVSALYRGEPIEDRIRRILDGPSAGAPVALRRLVLSLAVVIGLSLLVLHPIHELLEAAIQSLP